MERTEQIFFQSFLQSDLTGNVMIEEFIDAFAIGTLGCCRHAKPEFRFEIIKDLLVGICGCPVHFIDDNPVKMIGSKLGINVFSGQGLHRGEQIVFSVILLGAGKHAIGSSVSNDSAKGFHGLAGYLFPVHQKENSFWSKLSYRKGSRISLTGSGGRN